MSCSQAALFIAVASAALHGYFYHIIFFCLWFPSSAGLAFGGGPYRCPGRFFAEMEIALFVQLLLQRLDFHIPEKPTVLSAGNDAPHSHSAAPKPLSALQFALLAVGGDHLRFGLGWFAPGSGKGWEASGDASSATLPPCELQKLVGMKVPAAPWRVYVAPAAGRL